MSKSPASRIKLRELRTTSNCDILTTVLLVPFLAVTSATTAQTLPAKKDYRPGILSIAYFIESANNSINSLNSLLKKDNYRNKITTLNNPTNNELGFSLKNEILTALKPILDKAKKTDHKKFREVIENFLSNPEENGISSVKKYLPALGIFEKILAAPLFAVIAEDVTSHEVIGCALLLGDNALFFYVKDVMVHPAWQSKQVGSAMMQHLTEWLDKNAPDNSFIVLITPESLKVFYQQFGFTPAFGMIRRIQRDERKKF